MSQVSRASDASRPRRRPDVETYVLPDGTALLYDPIADVGFPLDLMHSLLWDFCDGILTSEGIVGELAALLPHDDTAAESARQILAEFAVQGLLEAPTGMAPSS